MSREFPRQFGEIEKGRHEPEGTFSADWGKFPVRAASMPPVGSGPIVDRLESEE
jgi:hypothetical protein